MKSNKIYGIFLSLVIAGFFNSCNYNSFNEPQAPDHSGNVAIKPTHTIGQLKALYKGSATKVVDNIIIKGVVNTDDEEGNFYKSLYIQDETGGIELRLSGVNMGKIYPQGSTVVFKCEGLTLGAYGNQVSIGAESNNPKYDNGYISEQMIPARLLFVSKSTVEPRLLDLSSLKKEYAGTLVKLKDVQFIDSELSQTYADPENKKKVPAVNRTIIDKSGKTIIVRTSSYSKFAGLQLPKGSGEITALLTYFVNTPQLVIVRARDVKMNNPRF